MKYLTDGLSATQQLFYLMRNNTVLSHNRNTTVESIV
jgi:hypothetical protein